jgi:hypothetical protein
MPQEAFELLVHLDLYLQCLVVGTARGDTSKNSKLGHSVPLFSPTFSSALLLICAHSVASRSPLLHHDHYIPSPLVARPHRQVSGQSLHDLSN